MKCKDSHEMINSYIDNGIDPMKDKLLAEHIESCPNCRIELDQLNKYKSILKSVKPVSPPDNFLSELRRTIELEKSQNPINRFIATVRSSFDSLRFPLEAAGVLAAAVLIFFLYKPFFNEKIHETSSEYKVTSPLLEKSKSKDLPEVADRSSKKTYSKSIPSMSSEVNRRNEIMDDNSVREKAEDVLSTKSAKDFDSADMKKMKKAPSAESERTVIIKGDRGYRKEYTDEDSKENLNKEKSYSSNKIETKGAMIQKMDSLPAADSKIEKLFRELNVSVIKKDLSVYTRLHYTIKITHQNHTLLIEKLKKDFIVEEKIIRKNKPDYEIELFLKNK